MKNNATVCKVFRDNGEVLTHIRTEVASMLDMQLNEFSDAEITHPEVADARQEAAFNIWEDTGVFLPN